MIEISIIILIGVLLLIALLLSVGKIVRVFLSAALILVAISLVLKIMFGSDAGIDFIRHITGYFFSYIDNCYRMKIIQDDIS